jgi:hypothetical protein
VLEAAEPSDVVAPMDLVAPAGFKGRLRLTSLITQEHTGQYSILLSIEMEKRNF